MNSMTYTRIDPGTVFLSNHAWERQWSNFLGSTFSIYCKEDGREWAKASPEFCITTEDGVFTHLELGYTEWSETRDSFGAGVLARHRGDEFELEIHSIMFHNALGMLRRMRLYNVSTRQQRIVSLALEQICVEKAGLKVLWGQDFSVEGEHFCGDNGDAPLALQYPGGGLIFGVQGGGRYEIFHPNSHLCSLCPPACRTMEPGAYWKLPHSYLMPFAGKLEIDPRKNYADFMRACGQYRDWEAEREMDSRIAGEDSA